MGGLCEKAPSSAHTDPLATLHAVQVGKEQRLTRIPSEKPKFLLGVSARTCACDALVETLAQEVQDVFPLDREIQPNPRELAGYLARMSD